MLAPDTFGKNIQVFYDKHHGNHKQGDAQTLPGDGKEVH
jgi:hypothetical protein